MTEAEHEEQECWWCSVEFGSVGFVERLQPEQIQQLGYLDRDALWLNSSSRRT